MVIPDPSALRLARREVDAAEERLAAARAMLAVGGWADTEFHLGRIAGQLAVWTMPGGMFDHLERKDDGPSDH